MHNKTKTNTEPPQTIGNTSKAVVSWALTRENLSPGFAKIKGTDQPAHPGCLISAFVIRVLESIIS